MGLGGQPPAPFGWVRCSVRARVVALTLVGCLRAVDARWVCARLRTAVERTDAEHVLCDVSGLVAPDFGTAHVLACLQLTARRLGCPMRVEGVGRELLELLELAGLRDVLLGEPPNNAAEPDI